MLNDSNQQNQSQRPTQTQDDNVDKDQVITNDPNDITVIYPNPDATPPKPDEIM